MLRCSETESFVAGFDADDGLDHNPKNQNQEMKKVKSFLLLVSTSLLFRVKLVHIIKNLDKKLEFINTEAQSFRLPVVVVDACRRSDLVSVVTSEQQTNSFYVELNLAGGEADFSNIVNELDTTPMDGTFDVTLISGMGTPTGETCDVTFTGGMGGLGKITR